MREIKFRGKRIDNNDWVDGDLLKNSWGYFIINHFRINNDNIETVIIAEVIPETVGQYTEVKDWAEHDIIKFKNSNQSDKKNYMIHFGVIKYDTGCFVLKSPIRDIHLCNINQYLLTELYRETYSMGNLEYKINFEFERVGNIHDATSEQKKEWGLE